MKRIGRRSVLASPFWLCMGGWCRTSDGGQDTSPNLLSDAVASGKAGKLPESAIQLSLEPAEVVNAAAFSPDGSLLVVGGTDDTQRAAVDPFHSGKDGMARIAVSGGNPTLKLWRAERGRELQTLGEHPAPILAVAFSPDGRHIASGGVAGFAPDHEIAAIRPGERLHFTGVELGAHWQGGLVKVWDSRTGQLRAELTGTERPVGAVAFAFGPDNSLVEAFDSSYTLTVWSVETKGKFLTLHRQGRMGEGVPSHQTTAFSRDGQRLVSIMSDRPPADGEHRRTVKLWDISASRLRTIDVMEGVGPLRTVSFAPDGKRFVAESWDRTLWAWDFDNGRLLGPLGSKMTGTPHPRAASLSREGPVLLSFSPDGSRIVSGYASGSLRIWDASDGSLLRTVDGPARSPVRAVAFRPKGLRIASGGNRPSRMPGGSGAGRSEPLLIWDVDSMDP